MTIYYDTYMVLNALAYNVYSTYNIDYQYRFASFRAWESSPSSESCGDSDAPRVAIRLLVLPTYIECLILISSIKICLKVTMHSSWICK